jgi:D-alanine-D-alanine ligase
VLKTPRLGSSVGIEIVKARAELDAAVARVGGLTGRLLVEEFVPGREFTVPVLDLLAEGGARALPIIEIIVTKGVFFDYTVKYDKALNDEVCPAEITDDLADRLGKVGLEAHRALGCRAISRTDVRVTPGGALYVLETNTLPGLTGESLYPKAARVAGLPYGELLTRLLDDAIARGPA